MKRKSFVVLFLSLTIGSGMLSAQSQYYYRTGDTIVGRSPIYFYQWWSENWLADTTHRITILFFGSESETNFYSSYLPQNINFLGIPNGELLQYCYTETPLNIIGIATSCSPFFSANDPGENPSWQEYVRLYDATEDDFVLLKPVP